MSNANKKPRATKKVALTAKTADRHALYEQSVQDPASDVQFIDRIFRQQRGRKAATLREDFCGTGYLCAEWVKSATNRTALGLDLDKPTMRWGTKQHLEPLGAAASRVTLRHGNVLSGCKEKVDVITAFNFSYCCLLERPSMARYFARAHANLVKDGIMFLDIHGGPECLEEMEETTKLKGFTYVWDQGPYDAITNLTKRSIHFRFPDKTEIKNAYTYFWRPWQLGELRDLLTEAGFRKVDIYWEGTDARGEGNGEFRRRTKAQNDDSWIAYIVAVK